METTQALLSFDDLYLNNINNIAGLFKYIEQVKNIHTSINYTRTDIIIDSRLFYSDSDNMLTKTINVLNNFTNKNIATTFNITFNYSNTDLKYKPLNLQPLYDCIKQFKNIEVLSINNIKIESSDIDPIFDLLKTLPNLNKFKLINTDLNDDSFINIVGGLRTSTNFKKLQYLDFSGNLITSTGFNYFLFVMHIYYNDNNSNGVYRNLKELVLTDKYHIYPNRDKITVYNDYYIINLFENMVKIYALKPDFSLKFKIIDKEKDIYYIENFNKINDVNEFINKSNLLVKETYINDIAKYKGINVYQYLWGIMLEYKNDSDDNNIIKTNIKSLFTTKNIVINKIIDGFEPNNKIYHISVYVDIDRNDQVNTIFTDANYLTNDIFKVQKEITTSSTSQINKPNNYILYIIILAIILLMGFLMFKKIII